MNASKEKQETVTATVVYFHVCTFRLSKEAAPPAEGAEGEAPKACSCRAGDCSGC